MMTTPAVSRSRAIGSMAGAFASVAIIPGKAFAAGAFNYKYGHHFSTDHPIHVRSVQMWDAVRKETNGRLNVRSFPNSQLGGDIQMLSQLRAGALEMQAISGAFLSTVVPSAALENVPYTVRTLKAAWALMDGPVGAYMRKETAEKTGIYMFENVFDSGFRQITSSTHPIRTAADFAGFRVRIGEIKIFVDLFKGLGASPTPLAAPELYTALQTKTVDGQDNPLNTVETARYFEVQKYLSITNHMWAGDWLAINGDAWEKLPADIKLIVQKHAHRAVALERGDSARLAAATGDKLVRQGLIMNVTDYNSCKAKLVASGFYTALREQFGSTAWTLLEAAIGKVG